MVGKNASIAAAAYARASRDDPDSSTIDNQLALIRAYAESMPEIRIVSERYDNGYSGIDFLRPDFMEMMKDITAGKVNCVIVKDFSRLGRNYIEVGELMDEVFPRLGVRLIAINEQYDSAYPRAETDNLLIPFKNLINEQYLRDLSIKIRSNLRVKRRNGEFVAAFAPYGYVRDERDRHRLAVDQHAAGIVQDIFNWKIGGLSQQKIAERLNNLGEPSPLEYKTRQGSRFVTGFQTYIRASWSAAAVGRVLRDPVYVGTLIQGKRSTPNFKVKKRITLPREEWCVVTDTHEPIITRDDFEAVQRLLRLTTRAAPANETVFPLAGLLRCGDCGRALIRKKVNAYVYYICAANKTRQGCTPHTLKPDSIEATVREAVNAQLALMPDGDMGLWQGLPDKGIKITAQLADRECEIRACERYKNALSEDFQDGVMSEEDYHDFSQDYTARIEQLQAAAERLRREQASYLSGGALSQREKDYVVRHRKAAVLSRPLAVSLIQRIDVYEGKRVTIQWNYADDKTPR